MKIRDQERLMKAVERVLVVKPLPFSPGDGIDALWQTRLHGLREALINLAFVYSDVDIASRS